MRQFEAAPGAHVNRKLTMGENIADLAGIQVALDAYHRSLNGKPAPVIDGLTGDQRLFLAWAQVWRDKQREDALRSQVTTDPHSPGRFRGSAPVRNVDAWYDAFGVMPGNRCTSRRSSAPTSGRAAGDRKGEGVVLGRLPFFCSRRVNGSFGWKTAISLPSGSPHTTGSRQSK